MHTLNRLLAVLVFLGILLPLGTSALLLTAQVSSDQLQQVITQAKDGQRLASTLDQSQQTSRRIIDETAAKLSSLYRKEHVLRLQIAMTLETMGKMHNRSDALAQDQIRMLQLAAGEQSRLADFIRGSYVRLAAADTGPEAGKIFVARLLGESLGQQVENDLRATALARARTQLITAVLQSQETTQLTETKLRGAAGDLAGQLTDLQTQRDDTLAQMAVLQRKHDTAQQSLTLSADQLDEIQRETADVQNEVLRLQSEMAQIDARLRTRAERELIQKGLRAARPGQYANIQASTLPFQWPAIGPVSAGFHDAHYQEFFGVPHTGMDIVVPQGTPVHSAADGIVFLAHDGGLKGFSYILIGHRNGFATLYGHLSAFAVSTGEYVTQGQLIGESGGTPGTHGAGPMTTAAHLHFEIRQNGVATNPRVMLP